MLSCVYSSYLIMCVYACVLISDVNRGRRDAPFEKLNGAEAAPHNGYLMENRDKWSRNDISSYSSRRDEHFGIYIEPIW